MNEKYLRPEERISIRLRALFQSFGYRLYKVNRFEEYDLYMRNKNFLEDERILTFSDTDGKLMALKPDITLSIVKNTRDEDTPLKVCYAESAYRVPRNAYGFREITQTGIEYIGPMDSYTMGEVLLLAAMSLKEISENYALDVSSMGVVAGVLADETLSEASRADILKAISAKNLHGLKTLCEDRSLRGETEKLLEALINLSGEMEKTLPLLKELPLPAAARSAVEDLERMSAFLKDNHVQHVNLDFSVVNDMNYYNGLIFSGFIEGVPAAVLSGGRYDPLLTRMGRKSEAIGFAVYLDQLENLPEEKKDSDVDALILYDDTVPVASISRTVRRFVDAGKSVCVQQTVNAHFTCQEMVDLRKGSDAQ